jgi:hypothetical protein
MHYYAIPTQRFLIATRVKRSLRQFLLIWAIASAIVCFNIPGPASLSADFAFLCLVGVFVFGLPIAIACWFLYRVIAFAVTG